MAWDKLDKLIERGDTALDLILVGLGLSQFRRGATAQSGAPATATRARPPSPPKIPKILLDMEDAKREEIAKWLKQYPGDALERLGEDDLKKLFEKSEIERDQIISSLGIPLPPSKKLRLLKEKIESHDPELEAQIQEMAASAEQRRREREDERWRRRNEVSFRQDCANLYRRYMTLGRLSRITVALCVIVIIALLYQLTR